MSEPMRIGIYRDALDGRALGGGEYCVAVLAEAFEPQHEVEVLSRHSGLNAGSIREFFGIDLRTTTFHVLPPPTESRKGSRAPWRSLVEAVTPPEEIARGYDVFVCITHEIPPFCPARRGVLLVLFPSHGRGQVWPWNGEGEGTAGVRQARLAYHSWLWRRRFVGYRQRLAISEYTRRWTERHWRLGCEVVYPPVDIRAEATGKRPSIVSVGRFTRSKKQLEMAGAFASLVGRGVEEWSYDCVGGLGDDPRDTAYYAGVRDLAAGLPMRLITNPTRSELEASLSEASIFWHAMGYREDEDRNPFAIEHFGISTVEAMARGCVPVVINRGGPAEVVRHEIDGLLWDSLEELEAHTMRLIRDEGLRRHLAASARERALEFRKERFVEQMAARCGLSLGAPA